MIGPNRALTASHVMDDHHRKWTGEDVQSAQGDVSYALYAWQNLEDGKYKILWAVSSFTCVYGTDLAVLTLKCLGSDIPDDASANVKPIYFVPTLGAPKIGAEVAAFGYTKSIFEIRDLNNPWNWHWIDEPATATGTVTEIFPLGRDSTMLPFPAFTTNARFDGGMSGGPIVTKNGLLCGIVCSSLGTPDGHVSNVSLLWPALSAVVPEVVDGVPTESQSMLYEIAKRGELVVRELDFVQITICHEEQMVRVAFLQEGLPPENISPGLASANSPFKLQR